jgi:ParB-like chromosome segregation protein Spo0J
MKKLPFEVHPAANIFPMIKGAAFKELVDDIRDNGINEPIVFWNGKLLDGRNRSMACLEIGIDPLDHAIDINPETDPVAFVLSANLHRRHLGETEREVIGAKIANLKVGDVKTQKGGPSFDGPAKSTAEAAEQLNVSESGVERAKAALKGGCKSLCEALEAGEIPSSTAKNFVKAVPDKKEQAKILEQGLPAIRQAIKDAKADQSRPTTKKSTPKKSDPEPESQPEPSEPATGVQKRIPEWVAAFGRSSTKANDMRIWFDRLDDQYKTLLKDWLAQ